MKKLLMAVLLSLIAVAMLAQGNQHGVEVTWTSNDPSATGTYNVYRFAGACPATATGFTKINTAPITALSYFDPAPAAINATLCYYVTEQDGGLESSPSPTAQVVYLPRPFAPGNTKAIVQ